MSDKTSTSTLDRDTADTADTAAEVESTTATDAPEAAATEAQESRAPRRRRGLGDRTFSARSLVRGAVAAIVLLAVVGVIVFLGMKVNSQSDRIAGIEKDGADRAHAEKVALDYSNGAAQMDYQKPDEWIGRLTKGTSPEMTNRLRQAATSMQQLITPLQWTSTSQPIAAKVQSSKDGVYQVVTFVDVMTKNAQTPDGIQSTATYRMTIDSRNDWQITDISGIGSALGGSGPTK